MLCVAAWVWFGLTTEFVAGHGGVACVSDRRTAPPLRRPRNGNGLLQEIRLLREAVVHESTIASPLPTPTCIAHSGFNPSIYRVCGYSTRRVWFHAHKLGLTRRCRRIVALLHR